MAKANDAPSFEEMESVTNRTDDDDDILKLDPGEKVVVQIRHRERNVGQYDNTLLHVTTNSGEHRSMWSNSTIENALEEIDPDPDEWVGIKKDSESYSYETDDGESGEAYGFDVRQMPSTGGDD